MEKKIKLNEKTTVYGTGECKHYTKDEAYKVHPELAKKLIAAGKATDKKPKATEK
jgi:hypothetical protein